MGELMPIFLVAGGFVGAIGLLAWLTRKNKGGDEETDTFLSSTTDTETYEDVSSSSSDSGSSDSGGGDSGSSSRDC